MPHDVMNCASRAIAATTFLTALVSPGAFAAPPGAPRDFNGDGFDDLAIGVESENVNGVENAGAAHVLYGSVDGVTVAGEEFWHQDRDGIDEVAEENDHFGYSFAVGDFDGNGKSDLAISAPFESHGMGPEEAGVVHVLYGGGHGLRSDGAQLFSQSTAGIESEPETNDNFGIALAAGDFDNDGFDDLAIGVPEEELDGVMGAGAVHVLYGSSDGLTTERAQFWHRARGGIEGDLGAFDEFGWALATGDFDDDSFDDLAVGVQGDEVNGNDGAGSVHAIFGSADGLSAQGSQLWSKESPGIHGSPRENEGFGAVLASGDFNGDVFDDLAVGAPYETINGITTAGAAYVIFGSGSGLTGNGAERWHEDVEGVPDRAEGGEGFGYSLATGDFDDDGFDDLAIGTVEEDFGLLQSTGAVHVLRGSAGGITTEGAKRFTQESNNIETDADEVDFFGEGLLCANFDGDRFDDLAIGVAGEEISGQAGAGAVHVLFGRRHGLKGLGSMFLHQDVPGISDRAEESEDFGFSLGR